MKDIIELYQAEQFLECIPPESEAGSVMIGKADFVDHPVSAFVRLSEGRLLGIRVSYVYMLFCLSFVIFPIWIKFRKLRDIKEN